MTGSRPGPLRERIYETLLGLRLNTEGRVDLRPARGAFVHEPTEEEADQLLTARTLLATGANRPWRTATPTWSSPSTPPATPR
ncbi:hypothetical protein [Streptomyces sp. NPDC015345]|uniref:hypothetical protein n=1 Tax=Streptomyces sp. NPDC015345 TaxID=3364953 RepID=UPI0036F524A7